MYIIKISSLKITIITINKNLLNILEIFILKYVKFLFILRILLRILHKFDIFIRKKYIKIENLSHFFILSIVNYS